MNAPLAEVRILDELLDPLRACLSADVAKRLLQLRATPEAQAKLDLFAGKNSEGTLTPDEHVEYDALVRAGSLIAVLQSKARSVVESQV